MTTLGLGTYRSRDAAHAASVAAAAGVPLIDTAPVYGGGAHQTAIARVLTRHPGIRIATKVGHMTPRQAESAVSSNALTRAEAHRQHSVSTDYVRHQIQANRSELHRPCLDLVYLHNPEHNLNGDRDAVRDRIRGGFLALEQARSDGHLQGYGVATWSGFSGGAFTVADLVRLAQEAVGGPNSGLAALQLPVSMVKVQPIRDALGGHGPVIHGRAAGLEVWASAPLHGGELPPLVNRRLADCVAPGATAVEAALLVAASTPGLTGLLLSASSTGHWNSAAAAVRRAPLPASRLKEICDLLHTG